MVLVPVIVNMDMMVVVNGAGNNMKAMAMCW